MAEKIKDLSSVINIDGAEYNIHAETAKVANDTEKLGGVSASNYALKTELFSKNYNDLTNKPTIPTNTDTTYDLSAAKNQTNGNVTLQLIAGGSGSGTDYVKIQGSGATSVTTDSAGVITISSTGGGGTSSGDMLKSVYDTNNNNKVDVAENAEKLGGTAASDYAKKADLNSYVLKTSITVSQNEPSGGAAGDIWFKY